MAENKDILKALLAPKNEDVRKSVFMKRFGIDFEVRALEPAEVNQITQRATRFTSKKEKVFDDDLFNYLTIAKACIVPNWEDKELQEGLGVSTATDAIKKRLLFGEVATLLQTIAELNGFDQSDEDQVEQAKN